MIQRFKKKPVVVEAVELTRDNLPVFKNWIGSNADVLEEGSTFGIAIHTLEGTLSGHEGDFVVKGIKGEFWCVRRDIFLETYEPA